MSRNSSGTYTLPSGNPVISGTLIEASWANTTLSDLASAMTDSLSRSGQGGMTAALRLYDGTSSVPGLAWGSETTTGWYRAGTGDMRLVVTGSEVMKYLSTGVTVTGTLGASGNTSVGGTLGVTGATTLAGALTINGGIANNPTLSAGTANGVAYLNGSQVLTTGSALTFDGTKLGIGGTASQIIHAQTSGTSAYLQVQSSLGSAYYGVDGAGVYIGSTSNIPSVFNVNGSEQMRLTSTGLGIGTSSPSYKLTVAGSADSVALGTTLAYGSGGEVYSAFRFNNSSFVGGNSEIRNIVNGAASLGSALAFFTSQTGSGSLTERMRIDNAGNLGLGVTPSAWGSGSKAIEFPFGVALSSFVGYSIVYNNAYHNGTNYIYKANGTATSYQTGGGSHYWLTAPSGTAGDAIGFTQAMTLDASGNWFVGTTTGSAKANIGGATASYGYATRTGTTGSYSGNFFNINWSGTTASLWVDATNVGNITLVSDYRVKKNVATQTAPALKRVMQLRPVTYEFSDYKEYFKADGVQREGFIAHELQAIIPSAVDGKKDDENQIQSLKMDALVSVLVKAVQELAAEVAELRAQ